MNYKDYLDKCYVTLVNNNITAQQKYELIFGEKINQDTAQRRLKGVLSFINILNKNEDTINIITSKSEVSIGQNGKQTHSQLITMTEEQSKDANFLLKAHGYSSDFDLIEAKNSIWGSSSNTLYSSKITVRPKSKNFLDFDSISKELLSYFKESKPCIYIPKNYEYGAECLIPCLFDLHFAKYCSLTETGNLFCSDMAKENIISVVRKYIDRFKDRKFEKIIFPIGNDFFNSEYDGCTTNHTKQDNDLTYSEMFCEGIKILTQCIDLLSQLAPVDVVLVQGNHSSYSEFYLACVLDAYYKDNKYITVDNKPIPRKYIQFGNVLLGFTHGNEEKDRIFNLMQSEVPELWGKTSTHEFIVGHEHHEEVEEKNGVVVRKISTITGSDAWHTKMGFTMAKKKAMAFIYDKQEGLVDISYINI